MEAAVPYLFFGFLILAALGAGGSAYYNKFIKQIRNWPEATSIALEPAPIHNVPEEPFYTWWKDNKGNFATGDVVTLDNSTKRLIDGITMSLTGWQYIADKGTTDWEPVSKEQRSGDCEDYARVLAMLLVDKGIPQGAMTFVTGLRGGYFPQWHALLSLNTDKGTYFAEVGKACFESWRSVPFLIEGGSPNNWLLAGQDGLWYKIAGKNYE